MKKMRIGVFFLSLVFVSCNNTGNSVVIANDTITQLHGDSNINVINKLSYDDTTLKQFKVAISTINVAKDMGMCNCVDQLLSLYQIMDYYFPEDPTRIENTVTQTIQAEGVKKFEEIDKVCKEKDNKGLSECPNYTALQTYIQGSTKVTEDIKNLE